MSVTAGEYRWVRFAVGVCIVIAVFVASAAFLLSFSALHHLALRAGVPSSLAWLWPLVVDVTIVQSTVALVALAHIGAQSRVRLYFWVLGIGAVCVSLLGNAADMALAPGEAVTGMWAAAVAVVAPVSLLASTHAVLILVRQQRSAASVVSSDAERVAADRVDQSVMAPTECESSAPADLQNASDETVVRRGGGVDSDARGEAAVSGPAPDGRLATARDDEIAAADDSGVDGQAELFSAVDRVLSSSAPAMQREIAEQISSSGRSGLSVDDVCVILQQKSNPARVTDRELAEQFSVHPTTISRVCSRAESMGWDKNCVVDELDSERVEAGVRN